MAVLTVREIYDLACFAGFTINHSKIFMPSEDEMETEITVSDCLSRGIVVDFTGIRKHYKKVAYYTEYPEEGVVGLGEEIKCQSNT